jgi:hypothetical protein
MDKSINEKLQQFVYWVFNAKLNTPLTCPAENGCLQRDSQYPANVLSQCSQLFEQVKADVEYTHSPHPDTKK